jgi:hypothetical protein
MIKFYLNKHGQIVSVREGSYCDGKNFYRLNLAYKGNEDFLREAIFPPADIMQAHLARWKLTSQTSGEGNNSKTEKPAYSAS